VSHDESAHAGSDADVIARSVREPECFGLIWDRYAGDVHRFVMRRLGRDLADDVTAETFAAALRQRARFEPGRSARPWLFGIAANLIGKHRRTEIRGLRAVARLGIDPVERSWMPEGVEERVMAGSARPALASALAELATGDRHVLLLVAWADLTYAEVAEALGIPVGTVRSRLHRARQAVRRSLTHDPLTEPMLREVPTWTS
jgi:RNA polymerase sigma-70 factor (ECF subfamily)